MATHISFRLQTAESFKYEKYTLFVLLLPFRLFYITLTHHKRFSEVTEEVVIPSHHFLGVLDQIHALMAFIILCA